MAKGVQGEPRPQLTHVESFLLFAQGVLKSWLVLAVGATAGYGMALGVGWWLDLSVQTLRWDRVTSHGPITVLVLYGMGGVLIEALRVQGRPPPVSALRGWSAARRLRAWLLATLGAAAVGVGLYVGLWW